MLISLTVAVSSVPIMLQKGKMEYFHVAYRQDGYSKQLYRCPDGRCYESKKVSLVGVDICWVAEQCHRCKGIIFRHNFEFYCILLPVIGLFDLVTVLCIIIRQVRWLELWRLVRIWPVGSYIFCRMFNQGKSVLTFNKYVITNLNEKHDCWTNPSTFSKTELPSRRLVQTPVHRLLRVEAFCVHVPVGNELGFCVQQGNYRTQL